MMKTYSTKEAADLAGIHWTTLTRWVEAGRVHPSQVIPVGERELWRWTDAGIRQILRFREKFYADGQGRRKPKLRPKQ